MKKIHKLIIGIILVVAFAVLIGFIVKSADAGGKEQVKEDDDFSILETDVTQKSGYKTFATELPLNKELKKESQKQGTVMEFSYETSAYALEQSSGKEEVTITKTALIYLPYGYDANKAYDILYLMHGGGESQYYWIGDESMVNNNQKTFGKTTRNVLDNMIANGISKEVIVVAPTFYTEVDGSYVDANTLCVAFAKELRNDLIPAIESQYTTYAGKDVSIESLQQSRDHRAFAGFSMGAYTTIQAAMMRNLDVFSYFGVLSGSLTESNEFKKVLESEEYKDLPIHYMYNGNGTMDIAHDEHKVFCAEVLAEMPERFVDGENFAWIDYEDGYHAYNSWITDLHNCLTVFFQ